MEFNKKVATENRYAFHVTRYVVPVFLSFIIGIAIASWLPEQYLNNSIYFFTAAVIFLIAAVFVYWFADNKKISSKNVFFCLPAIALATAGSFAFMFFGLWRYSLIIFKPTSSHIVSFANQKLDLTAIVSTEPELRPDQTRYTVGGIQLKEKRLKLDDNLLVVASINPEYYFGDQLRLSCYVQTPQEIEGFAYDRYLAKSDIYALCYQPQIELIKRADFKFSSDWQGYSYSRIYKLKNTIRQIYISALGDNESSLANGIILGDQKIMDKELRQNYANSGLAHIIAISGMNMTFISAFVLILLISIGLWRRQAFYFTFVLLWFYTIMIGLPASAVRASIMSSLLLFALAFGRLAKIERLVVVVATIMLMLNPRLLRDDIGFQLSYAAFLGVVYFYKPLIDWFRQFILIQKVPEFIIEGFAMTLAAQILSWPIMVNNFNQISIIAPFVNILALPLLAPVMILLIICLALASLLSVFTVQIFAPAGLILAYLNWLAVLFGQMGWSIKETDNIGPLLTIIYYCCMVYVVRKKKFNRI